MLKDAVVRSAILIRQRLRHEKLAGAIETIGIVLLNRVGVFLTFPR